MALTQGNAATWADINALYTTMRSAQSKHSLSQTAIPSYTAGSSIVPAAVTNLITGITALAAESHIKGKISVPAAATRGNPIAASYIAGFRTAVDTANNTCHFDSFNPCSFDNNFFDFHYGTECLGFTFWC